MRDCGGQFGPDSYAARPRWIGNPIWTVSSETEPRIPELNRAHVA